MTVAIRHQRPNAWPTLLAAALLATFWLGVCVLSNVPLAPFAFLLMLFGTILAFFGCFAIAISLLFRRPIATLSLGDSLQPRPGSDSYAPKDIRRIVVAADPHEDYCDEPIALREIQFVFRPSIMRPRISVISSDTDADLVTEWATRSGIEFSDLRPCRSTNPGGQRPDDAR
jgi:hypothetical protein